MDRPHLSTHVLDTSKGLPVSNLSVKIEKYIDNTWTNLGDCKTSTNGRCEDLLDGLFLTKGKFKLIYQVDDYFSSTNTESFYSTIEIIFVIKNHTENHHIPLLLNPFGYTTYRGT